MAKELRDLDLKGVHIFNLKEEIKKEPRKSIGGTSRLGYPPRWVKEEALGAGRGI